MDVFKCTSVGVEAMHDCLILPWAITIGSIHLTE